MDTVSPLLLEILEKELPPFFTRAVAAEKLCGAISRKTLATYNHQKTGPPVHRIGRRVFYEKKEFLQWLEAHYGEFSLSLEGNRQVMRRKT